MPAVSNHRTARVKDDDQIAFENGSSFEEVCSYQKALDWYAEVKPTGGYWDRVASAGRVAILVALGRTSEAIEIGWQAIQRMQQPSPELIGETARALNASRGPLEALDLCRRWMRHPAISQLPALWHSAAAYASQCGQFERALRYLACHLQLCARNLLSDLLLDRDFAPLWHHLENDTLPAAELALLRHEIWSASLEPLRQKRSDLSFESYAHVPASLHSILRVHTRTMNWVPHRDTPPAKRTAFDAWCQAVRDASLAALQIGLRKALAQSPVTGGECA